MDYLHQLAVEHGNKILLEHKGASWTDASFLSHVLQRTSIGIKKAAAKEIRRAIRNKIPPPKRCYSMSSQRGAAPPRPEGSLSAPKWRTGRLRATHLPFFPHWVFDALGTPCCTACI